MHAKHIFICLCDIIFIWFEQNSCYASNGQNLLLKGQFDIVVLCK